MNSADNLSISELSKTQRRQHVKLVPKKLNKLNRAQQSAEQIEQLKQQHKIGSQERDLPSSSNKWVVNNRDKNRADLLSLK